MKRSILSIRTALKIQGWHYAILNLLKLNGEYYPLTAVELVLQLTTAHKKWVKSQSDPDYSIYGSVGYAGQ